MTMTKRQLRAEASERLKSMPAKSKENRSDVTKALLGDGYDMLTVSESVNWIIDLLSDDAPTNGISDGTNGIRSAAPLGGELPDGDAVAIMRRAIDNQSSPTFCALVRYLGMSDGLSVSWHEADDVMRMLADMIERDYKRREEYVALGKSLGLAQDELIKLKSELEIYRHDIFRVRDERDMARKARDSWKDAATREKRTADDLWFKVREIEKERDELKAANDRLQLALDTVEGCDGRCKRLEADRDEWKAKAEGNGAERTKGGATNLEWFYRNYDGFAGMAQWWAVWESLCDDSAEAEDWLLATHVDDRPKTQSDGVYVVTPPADWQGAARSLEQAGEVG